MTVGSLFAGIGGFDLGLERAGMTVRWQVEVDPYARGILERHWPAVYRCGDIRLVEAADLESVDLVCGGFPCQDISSAGKGAGLNGRRSGLWREMLRLVRGLRPRWVLAENVPRLRTLGGDRVLADLEAEGYACWPLVVGAWAVGAPHRRDRVWIVARRVGDAARIGCAEGNGPGPARGDAEPRGPDAGVGHANGPGLEGRGLRGGERADERAARATDGAAGVADGDRCRCECLRCRRLPAHVWATCRYDADGRHRWPTRPGEAQHDWEPPRTTQSSVGGRLDGSARRLALKALGNMAMPAVVEALGRAIVVADQNAP